MWLQRCPRKSHSSSNLRENRQDDSRNIEVNAIGWEVSFADGKFKTRGWKTVMMHVYEKYTTLYRVLGWVASSLFELGLSRQMLSSSFDSQLTGLISCNWEPPSEFHIVNAFGFIRTNKIMKSRECTGDESSVYLLFSFKIVEWRPLWHHCEHLHWKRHSKKSCFLIK